jgi:hypothetical protein
MTVLSPDGWMLLVTATDLRSWTASLMQDNASAEDEVDSA